MTLNNIRKFYEETYKLSKIEENLKESFRIAVDIIESLSEEQIKEFFPQEILTVEGRLLEPVFVVSLVPKDIKKNLAVVYSKDYFQKVDTTVKVSKWPTECIEGDLTLCSVRTIFVDFLHRKATFILSTDLRIVSINLFGNLFNGNVNILNDTDYSSYDYTKGSTLEISIDFKDLTE